MTKLNLAALGNTFKGVLALARELNLEAATRGDVGHAVYSINAVLTGMNLVVGQPTAEFLRHPYDMPHSLDLFARHHAHHPVADLFLFDIVCAAIACDLQECRFAKQKEKPAEYDSRTSDIEHPVA